MGRNTGRTGLCCGIDDFIVYKAYTYDDHLIKPEYVTVIGVSKNSYINVTWH